MKLLGIFILLLFYAVYLGKMLLQRQKGIQTDQMAKGKPKGKRFYTELLVKLATYTAVAAEAVSIFTAEPRLPRELVVAGAAVGLLGDAVFTAAVLTMKDSWRAGIAEHDRTEIVTGGIYRVSRNPAFLGFDCVYLGLLLMFFNIPLLAVSLFAAVMLHLQILQEERYLSAAFGETYTAYKNTVHRYLGRKR